MIDSTLEYLFNLHNRGIKLGLLNIKNFLKECDNPENHFKSIHIAGTNGKGSTGFNYSKDFAKQWIHRWSLYFPTPY
jgi:folylpolyglutamate synthase/dihydropteroate synthase